MKHILEKLNKIKNKKKDSYFDNLTYEYLLLDSNKNLIQDEIKNKEYGSSRKGYEKFKEENFNIGISGDISLRTIHKNKELVGYLVETQISSTPKADEFKELYAKTFSELSKKLDITDVDGFNFFLDENFDGGLGYGMISYYTNKIELLVDIYERYLSDEDYRNFINKIK